MSLDDALDEMADEVARKGAEQWRQDAIDILRDTGERLEYNVEPIIQSITPVTRNSDGSYGFTVQSEYATIIEYGSDPHTIEADDGALRFETDDGDVLYAKSVEHPGTTAILFVSKSRNSLDARGIRRDFLDD